MASDCKCCYYKEVEEMSSEKFLREILCDENLGREKMYLLEDVGLVFFKCPCGCGELAKKPLSKFFRFSFFHIGQDKVVTYLGYDQYVCKKSGREFFMSNNIAYERE